MAERKQELNVIPLDEERQTEVAAVLGRAVGGNAPELDAMERRRRWWEGYNWPKELRRRLGPPPEAEADADEM